LSIFDSYACRKEKGQPTPRPRAQYFNETGIPYFLKLDIHKFFDSVDHGILKSQLRRRVKDPDLLWLLDVFVDHPFLDRAGQGHPHRQSDQPVLRQFSLVGA